MAKIIFFGDVRPRSRILALNLRYISIEDKCPKGGVGVGCALARLCFNSVIACVVPANDCEAFGASTTDSAESATRSGSCINETKLQGCMNNHDPVHHSSALWKINAQPPAKQANVRKQFER
jgi:hypothetical protein